MSQNHATAELLSQTLAVVIAPCELGTHERRPAYVRNAMTGDLQSIDYAFGRRYRCLVLETLEWLNTMENRLGLDSPIDRVQLISHLISQTDRSPASSS